MGVVAAFDYRKLRRTSAWALRLRVLSPACSSRSEGQHARVVPIRIDPDARPVGENHHDASRVVLTGGPPKASAHRAPVLWRCSVG